MGKCINLSGQKFGKLTVIERDLNVPINNPNGVYWICKCECGNTKSIKSASLRGGFTKSCGCLNLEIISKQKNISDMIGNTFGYLTVIERGDTHITTGGQKKVTWVCRCKCGNIKTVTSQDLKSGHTKSCGCIPTKKIGDGLIDLLGKNFGDLTVIKRADDYIYKNNKKNTFNSSPRWLCKCKCGGFTIAQGGNLRNGNTLHCGCKSNISKGEKQVADFLVNNNINFIREYTFDDLKSNNGNLLRFDFGILNSTNNLVMLIEYQGLQHYIDCGSFGEYQRKYSDKQKKKYCKNKKIPLYEIRYDDNVEHVLKKLLNEI